MEMTTFPLRTCTLMFTAVFVPKSQKAQIIHQLSYQGSPKHRQAKFKAMPPGDARLAGLGLILLPPAGRPHSPAPRPSKGPVPA